MDRQHHPHGATLKAIGSARLREAFDGMSLQRIGQWKLRGVPVEHLARVAKLAADAGVPIPDDFFAPLNLPAGVTLTVTSIDRAAA